MNKLPEEQQLDLKSKIHSETAKIPWCELQTFFAKGMAVYVSHKIDLVIVAKVLAEDDQQQFQQWMQDNLIANVSDTQATAWLESNILVWAVVVHPWVLVQPIVD